MPVSGWPLVNFATFRAGAAHRPAKVQPSRLANCCPMVDFPPTETLMTMAANGSSSHCRMFLAITLAASIAQHLLTAE
jgi:hypothetical protein